MRCALSSEVQKILPVVHAEVFGELLHLVVPDGIDTGSGSAFGKIVVRRAPYKLQPFTGGYYKKGFKGKSCKPLRFYGTDLRCKIQNLNA